MTEPFYYYQHTAAAEGGAATGAVFVPDGLWPTKYKFMFIDFIFGGIYNLVEDQNRACRTCSPPIPAFRNETFHRHTSMVDMFFGPYKTTQALYIVARSPGQNVRRIRYTGSTNRAPTAVATVSKSLFTVNEIVMFKGSGSSDPDGDGLTFLWNFGDGRASTENDPSLSYSQFGEYKVTLTVTDTNGQTSQAFVDIVVGTPPTAVMESPPGESEFYVGQVLRLKGSATDFQGIVIPDSQIFWEVRQHHASHFHPFLDKRSGNNFDLFPTPEPEDFMAATNSYLEVIMYAADSNGVTTTISRNVPPKKVLINIDSNPRGLSVLVDEFSVVTPATITSWQNHTLRFNVNDQMGNIFSSWSIGSSRKTTFKVPAAGGSTNPTIVAFFTSLPVPSEPVPTAPVPAPIFVPVPVPQAPVSVPQAPVPVPQAPVPIPQAPVPVPQAPVPVPQAPVPVPQSPVPVPQAPVPVPQAPVPVPQSPVPVPQAPVPVPRFAPTPTPRAPVPTGNPIQVVITPVRRIPLNTVVRDCSDSNPCKLCQGNCSNDDECDGALICFQKNAGLPGNVPGCIGVDVSKTDWCISP